MISEYRIRRRRSQRVYFIQCGDDAGPVKVGAAVDLKLRLKTLQVGCPYPLRLLASFEVEGNDEVCHRVEEGGDDITATRVEAWLHQELARVRIRGEWFDGTFVRDVIQALRRKLGSKLELHA